ncbi:KH homology domain-containing protein 4-like isoform X1 [Nerophis lumbriciformis]|uniref:KH homology domain-containing protein 4-like isoform X1 n=1 Tax=Nerophis lumbriciformis TaxID=546530 RepID=UPI002AE06240|nr:KH homology domain-containing protein 4-like isoform X1 [Nerophis lumbriciformis]
MSGQTPCLSSRWDQAAQPKPRSGENVTRGLLGTVSSSGSKTSVVATQCRVADSLMAAEDRPQHQGGVEMAAAMAAKINAMLMAKGKLLTPPPLLAKTPPRVPASQELLATQVDINHVPLTCRDLLTRGTTQEEIGLCSGAVVSTRGHYMPDTDQGNTGGPRPLYLHVQAKTQEQVDKAVARIKAIISEDLLRAAAASGSQHVPIMPPLTLYPQPPRPVVPTASSSTAVQGHRPAAPHSGNFVHTKIFVGLDQSVPSFNINEKVEGPGGTYLGHIQTETSARVFLRGKGSGYIEQASKRESFEPLYVYISHPNADGLEAAKRLTDNLLETVRAEHARLKSTLTASGSTQAYAAHGFPANSNYTNHPSWFNYPANGYPAFSAPAGYWRNTNGPSSHSNVSSSPPSSQAMVQYPLCPRKPNSYLVEAAHSGDAAEHQDALPSQPHSGSSLQDCHESSKKEEPFSSPPEVPAPQESTLSPSDLVQDKAVERILMPPPPPPFASLTCGPLKRPREELSQDPVGPSWGVAEDKRSRVEEDTSGLVPYGGDSSDEEEEKT